MIGVVVFGAIGFMRLGVSQLPDVDFPVVTASITWEGAAPEVMETDVTDIVEDAIMRPCFWRFTSAFLGLFCFSF